MAKEKLLIELTPDEKGMSISLHGERHIVASMLHQAMKSSADIAAVVSTAAQIFHKETGIDIVNDPA